MSEITSFSNEEILDSTMLSSMAYLKDRFIREGELLQKRSVSKVQAHIFVADNKITRKDIQTTEDLEKYVNKYLNSVTTNAGYRNVVAQKAKFYEKFKEEFGLEGKSPKAIGSIAKKDAIAETKALIAANLIKELKLTHNFFREYKESLENVPNQLNVRYKDNPYEAQLARDVKKLWEKFTPVEFSKEIQSKYKLYDPKNDNSIQASFNNGYIEAGKTKETKDGCLLMGYVKQNGKDVLYVSFRGTEQKVKPAVKYFLQNYPNMERQYNYFEPILKEIFAQESKKYQETHPGEKLEVVFTGHSLGASLAEKALDKFKDNESIRYKGIFVSNPGSFHYLQSVINKLDEWDANFDRIKEKNNRGMKAKFMAIGADLMKGAVKVAKASVLTLVGFTNYSSGKVKLKFKPASLNLDDFKDKYFMKDVFEFSTALFAKTANDITQMAFGFMGSFVNRMLISPFAEKKYADSRACTINHRMDNIPRIGKALFQNYNPQHITLTDPLPEIENHNIMGEVFQIDYHGREVYYAELKKEAKLGNLYKDQLCCDEKVVVVDRMAKIRENALSNKRKESTNVLKV
jgi:hypothetical protein